jgi:hypothetical protein
MVGWPLLPTTRYRRKSAPVALESNPRASGIEINLLRSADLLELEMIALELANGEKVTSGSGGLDLRDLHNQLERTAKSALKVAPDE